MPYPIEKKLVVGISSNALFDLRTEDEIFKKERLEAYRKYQVDNKAIVLENGVGFPFIKRFLNINKICTEEQPVEVVLLSRNSPETGVRIFNSIREYDLDITRAAFMSGGSAVNYIPAFNISLFLAMHEDDVKEALKAELPAGRILQTDIQDDDSIELKIAFDFDGVVANDEAEKVYKDKGIKEYHEYEKLNSSIVMQPGPLGDFFTKISLLQKLETEKKRKDEKYEKILKTAIITARNAPAHERVVTTLKYHGIEVDEAFFLGGIEKRKVLNVIKPHIFFDDQKIHLKELTSIPAVHIPFGIANVK